jgi:hypothetical protein
MEATMTVFSVTTTRVRDGKYQDALARYAKLKGVIERHGGRFHVRQQLFGANPLTLTTIVESAGWSEFGALFANLERDGDYQDFVASVRASPFGDIVQRNILTDVAI